MAFMTYRAKVLGEPPPYIGTCFRGLRFERLPVVLERGCDVDPVDGRYELNAHNAGYKALEFARGDPSVVLAFDPHRLLLASPLFPPSGLLGRAQLQKV